jgi:DNA-binding CsgD family transcriptional regulator
VSANGRRGGPELPGAELETLAALLDARLDGVPLTPGERAEALCVALGVRPALSAAARGVSADTVRASRRRLLRKLERALSLRPAARRPGGDGAGEQPSRSFPR